MRIGTPRPKHESIVSAAKYKADNVASDAREAIIGTSAPIQESVASQMSDAAASARSAASEAVSSTRKRVYGGAMAQEVGEQKPILDDVFSDDGPTYSEKMQNVVNQAGEKYAGRYMLGKLRAFLCSCSRLRGSQYQLKLYCY